MPAQRGAPPGNKNAFKHGFYSRDFPKNDLQDLEAVDSKGLEEEISLIRLHLRKLSEFALAAPTLAEYLDILRVLGLFTSSLNHLVKNQVFLSKAAPGMGDRLDRLLAEIQSTWTVDPPSEDLEDLEDLN